MTSPSPLLFDTYYHIFNRGNNRENIFIQERNYAHFLNLHFKYIDPIAETFAYCLLRNHFHMLVRIKSEKEIIDYRKTLKVSSANQSPSIQESHASQGASQTRKPLGSTHISSLFQHPFGRVPITSDRQFWNVIAYIHQNPQKQKFVDDFRDWKYSSYGILFSKNPTHLQRDIVLEWFGGRQAYQDLHSEWVTDAKSKWFAEDDND